MQETAKEIMELVDQLREKVNELTREQMVEYGKPALELVGDYPLYGAMSNIGYDEAILIELILGEEIFGEVE